MAAVKPREPRYRVLFQRDGRLVGETGAWRLDDLDREVFGIYSADDCWPREPTGWTNADSAVVSRADSRVRTYRFDSSRGWSRV